MRWLEALALVAAWHIAVHELPLALWLVWLWID